MSYSVCMRTERYETIPGFWENWVCNVPKSLGPHDCIMYFVAAATARHFHHCDKLMSNFLSSVFCKVTPSSNTQTFQPHLRHVPGRGADSGLRSGAWCAFRLVASFHFAPFCPDCTWHSQGLGCLHTSNAPGGRSLRQAVRGRGGSNTSAEPTGEQTRPSQHGADDHRENPNQPLQSVTPSNTSHSISIIRSDSNLPLALCAQLQAARGASGKWGRERREGCGERGVKHKSRSDHARWRWEAGITEMV